MLPSLTGLSWLQGGHRLGYCEEEISGGCQEQSPKSGEPPTWKQTQPSLCDCGSIPRCVLKGRWAEAVLLWGGEL